MALSILLLMMALDTPPLVGVGAEEPFLEVVLIGSEKQWKCSGVLVAPTKVLTAAHCVPAARVGVGIGVDHLLDQVPVESAAVDSDRDAAVLTLSRPVALKRFPTVGRRSLAPPYHVLQSVGFGAVDQWGRTGFGRRRTRALSRISVYACDERIGHKTGCKNGIELVALSGGATDACSGDSGGPLFERDPKSDTGWRVIALASRSISSARSPCGDGGIYTAVSWEKQ